MVKTNGAGGTATGLSRAAELLLVRLLPAGKGRPGPKRLRDELSRLGAEVASDDAWTGVLHELLSGGFLAQGKGLRPTDAGRARGLQVLGLTDLPPNATWPQLRDRHLVGIAAGRSGDDGLRSKPKLAAHMLARRFGLDLPDGATASTAAAALVCKELGFAGLSDFKMLQAAVLGRLLGSADPLPPSAAVEQFIRVRLGAPRGKVDELRRALVAEWVRDGDRPVGGTPPGGDVGGGGGASSSPAAPPASGGVEDGDAAVVDLPAFADRARRAAAGSATGWFGDNKVFIAHAWRRFRADGGPGTDLDLPAFKSRLIEANRAGLLALSRADLVAAMDPADVAESEARYLNTAFHFVLVQGGAR